MVHTRPLHNLYSGEVTMTLKTPFRFIEPTEAGIQIFCARLPGEIHNCEELLKALNDVLCFPAYFGFNWDALSECLRDFHWIPEKKIVLMHDKLPNIPEAQLKIYIEILGDAVLSWKPEEEHEFEVVFPESCRSNIEKMLSE